MKALRPDLAARLSHPKESGKLEDVVHTILDLAGLSGPEFAIEKSLFGGAE